MPVSEEVIDNDGLVDKWRFGTDKPRYQYLRDILQ